MRIIKRESETMFSRRCASYRLKKIDINQNGWAIGRRLANRHPFHLKCYRKKRASQAINLFGVRFWNYKPRFHKPCLWAPLADGAELPF